MANIKSQKKRILTNEKSRLRNNAYKSELKTYVRRLDSAVASGDKSAAETALRDVSRKYDKAEHAYPKELDLLAALLGLPAPTGTTTSFIGNR